MFRFMLICVFIWSCVTTAFARESTPLDTGRTEISLVSDYNTVKPGQDFTVLLRMRFDENWYTYWQNPGDSGEPVMLRWELPAGFSAGDIQWPVPHVKWVGPIASYALEGETFLPVKITVDETVQTEVPLTLRARTFFLVCYDVCVPEQGELSLPLAIGESKIDPLGSDMVATALSKIPQKTNAKAAIRKESDQLVFEIADLPKGFEAVEIFPNSQPVLGHSQPIARQIAKNGVRFTGQAGYGWDEDGIDETFDATLVDEQGKGIVVTVSQGATVDIGPVGSAASGTGSISFFGAIIGAFIGGLILNLMPCVFPVISLKALSLAKTAHGERAAIRREGWAYTAGVLVTFVLLAIFILGLKAGGASIGWGFQLQSPWLVGLLALLLFAIGLNLLGVYEIGGGLQNAGGGLIEKSGPMRSFLTGILAVIVATPCTAPFMAGAVGLALASSAGVTLSIFLALGLGFALPFLLIAYVPGLLSRLPKPGPWMETFKQLLAFPMFGAAIWLIWVLSLQAGAPGILRILSSLLVLGFGIWLFKGKSNVVRLIGGVFCALALLTALSVRPEDSAAELHATAWSPQIVTQLQSEGRPVFVDFTAAWCVTCKVNEGLVLNRAKTKSLFERTDTAFLVADWTNRDDIIAAELKRFGRAGVPLYLVYKPNTKEPEILPQTLSYKVLKEALED